MFDFMKNMGSKMENLSVFVKISTFFHLCHFHSTTRGQRKKVSMIIPMELWYNGHVFINKSIENSWQCLIICKIWGQKWQIGHFSPRACVPVPRTIFSLPLGAKRKRLSSSFLCISNNVYIYFPIKALEITYNA